MLTIAHRGGISTYGPDVIHACRSAIAAGADGVELDIQSTADGRLVVYHDRYVHHHERRRAVRSLSLSDLRAAVGDRTGNIVPLLSDVLATVGLSASVIILDIKADGIIDRVATIVREAAIEERVAVASFRRGPLVQMKSVAAALPTIVTMGISPAAANPLGLWWFLRVSLAPVAAAQSVSATALLCPAGSLSRRLVSRAHRDGLAVLVWDVVSSTDVTALVDLEVDGVVTDDTSGSSGALTTVDTSNRGGHDDD